MKKEIKKKTVQKKPARTVKSKKTKKETTYPEVNIGTIGHIAHGKSTLIRSITGKKTQEHSEELKRGLTIRLGYAYFTMKRCVKCKKYSSSEKCQYCKGETNEIRKISFVDSPGHETLMATMISGASTIDGAVLVIAANEPCPKPQTREHLIALEVSGIKKIIIIQNKIDLVDEEQARENYNQIKEFVKGTVAENAPIIPFSAQYGANLDVLLETIEKEIPTPKRDEKADPIFMVLRSFDVNKPGTNPMELKGGVFGGVMKQGKLKLKDKITILPGTKIAENWSPIESKIVSLNCGGIETKEIIPGGSSGIGTELDPFLVKSDSLAGQVIGIEGKMPPVWHKLKMEVNLLDRVVGSKDELQMEPLKTNEPLMLNVWTAKTVGVITSAHDDIIEIALKLPVCAYPGEKVVLSKKVGLKWRLIGYGTIK